MKTAIFLSDELVTAAEALAGRLGMSRSELYATAVAEFVAKHSADETTARLDAVFATESGALDPGIRRAQRRTFAREAW